MSGSVKTCRECGSSLSWASETCPGCGEFVGAPNVREVAAERSALVERHRLAVASGGARGCAKTLAEFEAAVSRDSVAVINLWPDFLARFLQDKHGLFSGYAGLLDAEARLAAPPPNDRERRGVEGILFGSYGAALRYAALSLDRRGLESYGVCAVVLRDRLCANRATLMEENSFHFVQRHTLAPGMEIPGGYRAGWRDRYMLAVAKLAERLEPDMSPSAFPGLLLRTDGNRATDEFIEVHIHGPFGRDAFVEVLIPNPDHAKDDEERYSLHKIRDLSARLGIPCKLI